MELSIKFISQERRIGPDDSAATDSAYISKAAARFNVVIGVTMRRKRPDVQQDSASEVEASKRSGDLKNNNTQVLHSVIRDLTKEDAAQLARFYFNHMEQTGNSDEYVRAKARFDSIKRSILQELHVDAIDELTKDQRIVYAGKMIQAKAPFIYTERSIHIKLGEYQTVYSKTVRLKGRQHWSEGNFPKPKSGFFDTYEVNLRSEKGVRPVDMTDVFQEGGDGDITV